MLWSHLRGGIFLKGPLLVIGCWAQMVAQNSSVKILDLRGNVRNVIFQERWIGENCPLVGYEKITVKAFIEEIDLSV